jgi:flagellin
LEPQITASNKENPMSLGVLNNLSAVYAENNLNNSNNSLSKTLQQLSSGSRINSGADDAAGLSLVDGLEANQTALTQSETNASEGVGLLQVADGALSQVTTLLNRAVTLATEASNGTLNSSQDTAANQEYQSILSEISNIGSTTTYNNQAVFNSNTNIYTGDSSTAGSAIDDLNISSLSSSDVGDTGGKMAYTSTASNGGDDVFLDLAHSGSAVALGDFLNAATPGAAAGLTVDTLSSTGTITANTISTGFTSTEGYANTVGGLINAINNSGLGLTASLTTGVAAGDGAAGQDSGIMITGAVGLGATPATASFSGSLSITGAAALTDTLAGSITIQDGKGASQTISMAQVAGSTEGLSSGSFNTADLAGLVNYINDYSTTANNTTETDVFGVHAAIGIDGLTLTSATGAGTANQNALSVSTNLTDSSAAVAPLTYAATAAYSDGINTNTAYDKTSGQTAAGTFAAGVTSGSGGVATIDYTDKAGQSLATTDLSNSADAQTALTQLNSAITDVAAQDGYIGAQINTLNAVSNVLSTQAENVQSAQNAVQATDYAQASSNMSKFEILSQTGISALAQANSMQQEVTKLLQ